MIRFIKHDTLGRSKLGWLDSHFHFSFAEYYNPENVHFGVLRVLNDDIVQPQTGFGTHPHKDFEIVSYVVEGELTHADSMNNKQTLHRGQAQYMSAGTGITHSEYNWGGRNLRFLQIWFFTDRKGYVPNYGDYRFAWEEREGIWMPIASGDGDGRFPIQLHADVHVYATEIAQGAELQLTVEAGRQAYLLLIEGEAEAAGQEVQTRDALEITEESFAIHAKEKSHFLLIEMAKSE
ncbi:MAG: pirin family protein [Lachnospiraceae bacterium]